ncbi:hypothetical protein ACFL7D_05960 [candidate division KSB1 bacterium]
MDGILSERVNFNGLHFEPGTSVHIDKDYAHLVERMDPDESLVVSVGLMYYSVKALVKKSQILFAA